MKSIKKIKEFLKKNPKVSSLYLFWVFMHIITLLISLKKGQPFIKDKFPNGAIETIPKGNFWPLEGYSNFSNFFEYYDLSEFTVYAITPLIIFLLIKLFLYGTNNKS